jgi:hypothetical protein
MLDPLPEVVEPPGRRVNVHEPTGNPLSKTLPVAVAHVGWVIGPTVGGAGVTGCASIGTFAEEGEIHPAKLVTVNVYVSSPGMFVISVLVPEPKVITFPGVRVMVHEPDEGNPLNATLPVETVHVG